MPICARGYRLAPPMTGSTPLPVGWLHLLCFALGAFGLMVMFVVFVWNKIANQY